MPAALESKAVTGRRALLVGLLIVVPAFAGCAGDDPPDQTVRPGSTTSTGSGSPSVTTPPTPEVRPKGTSERWHFHDYWKGNPTITLFEGNLTFNATPIGADGLPAMSAIFELPHGVIVPPETGYLTFNVTWTSPDPAVPNAGGRVNITYKPADSNDWFPGGETGNGLLLQVNTTESNCDVPHRQASAWRFNATARPDTNVPPGLPPPMAKVNITATIGRPLFIDPPHLNWWRDGDIIPLVAAASGEIRTAFTPAGNVTVPGLPAAPSTTPPNPTALTASYRVPVDAGRIVPEGTKSVVVMLNWTSQLPDKKLTLRYMENNYPSEGPMQLVSETATSRIYMLKTMQSQTDTTYSNRTTWEFRVMPEGEPASAFAGTFTLVAWASRLEPSATVAMVTAPAS